jgi:hypothetical protein
MIMTEEQAILKGQVQFEKMVEYVRQAARGGREIDEVERNLWKSLLGLGHSLLEGYVGAQGTGDMGETILYDGRILRRLESWHDRRYVSIFGELTIPRTVYGTRETQKHEVVPLDARLNLPDGDFSYVLQDWDQSFCVQDPYEPSRSTVARMLGLSQSVRSLEEMTVSMSSAASSFRDEQLIPPQDEEGPLLVLAADNKGVPMRRDGQDKALEKSSRRKKGEKANKKRMACVGAVYTIDPFVRTADDVVDELMRKVRQRDRPVPRYKQLRAELTRVIDGEQVNGKDLIFSWFADQVSDRNPQHLKRVVCVMDGERALWKLLASYVAVAICILDIFHVMERLWDAAYCFHPEGSEEAKAFVTDRLRRILCGEVGYVIGGLKQMVTKHRLRGSRKRQLSSVIGYLHRNRRFMRYDEYLAAGYPIGSGVAEGACRHLIKDRMEGTGMRWRTQGAQAMLELRAIYLNGDWDAFQQYRIEIERQSLYPYREMVQSQWNVAAAA